ncbi:beta-L-arabinofuranosidase domain-containing protein [Streptomyces coeruleorubidus]|uniref:beta-L-arabinofuranosidase domain-containing protein n=1 Tax=Streptomyces coeruleorubidus TaxID=116188 RepID=UPI003CCFFD02
MVAGPRMYALGGTGQGEMFRARDAIAATLDDKNAETCATYNMLKLSRQLFFHDPDPAYMDYYERGLTNHILASRWDAPSTDSPEVTYFVGMGPGVRRQYGNTGTCCGGTERGGPATLSARHGQVRSRALRNRQIRTESRLDHSRSLERACPDLLGLRTNSRRPAAYWGEWLLCCACKGA